MILKKIIVDHKLNTCTPCILKHSRDCGQMIKRQDASSGAAAVKVPDKRCMLREM